MNKKLQKMRNLCEKRQTSEKSVKKLQTSEIKTKKKKERKKKKSK